MLSRAASSFISPKESGTSKGGGGFLRAPSFLHSKSSHGDVHKGKPVHSVCRIERVNGSFSLRLNDYNRVTTVTRDSPADKSKLKPFDRILKVDGSALDGRKLSEVAAGKDAMLLDVERPPTSAYKVIFDHENQSERGPYLFDEGPSSGRPSGTVDEIPDTALEKLSGEETLTVVLSRENDRSFGLEVSHDNIVLSVDVDSAAHKAGLQVTDKITKLDAKPLNGPIADVLMSKGVSQNMVLTVLRGKSVDSRVSVTPTTVSADL